MELDKKEYLQKVLETHRMSHIDTVVNKHKKRRDEIKKALQDKYGCNAYSAFDSGSFGKHTAINIKFDLDIVVPYKRDSFSTIEAMFDDVYDFLKEKFVDKVEVRKQKVSIGVLFFKDEDGDSISIDVVPGRELKKDDYKDSKDLNLCFNENHWGYTKGSYTKTNIQSQIDHIKSKDNERKIIRLLKIWKHTNRENYKSFLLELITIKAFKKECITGSLWDMLKKVMEYIKDNIEKDNFTLIDPGNSNNDLIKIMETWERNNLANRMRSMIDRIDDNSENIKSYFPMNEAYKKEDDSNNSYNSKNGAIGFSIPPNNERFG